MKPRLSIALALILRGDEVLVQRRAANADHLPDIWEFPGGKVEPNETPAQAARREAREETGLEVEVVRALEPVEWDYPERAVVLHPFLARVGAGEAVGATWAKVSELRADEFPPANRGIIEWLQNEGAGMSPL